MSDRRLRVLLRERWVGACALGCLSLALYVRTAARSATFGDGPELAAAAYQLGVPHPTGYPLYTLLAHAFIRLLPFGQVIFRTTLLSAVTAALSVALLYILGTYVLRRRWIAAFIAALMAVSDAFWGQAVLTEVYGLHMLLSLAALTALLLWDRRGDGRYLTVSALCVGLGFAHHLMIVTWLPALALLMWRSPYRARIRTQWRPALLAIVLPLLFYLYLPWAAYRDPPMNWGDVRTLRNFWEHVTGAQYRFRMGHHSLASLWKAVYNYAGWPEDHVCEGYLLSQFSIAIVWLAPLGIWALARRDRRLLWFTVAAYGFPTAWALSYNIPDIDAYFLPSHVIVALWLGLGLKEVDQRLALLLRRAGLQWGERIRVRGLLQAGVLCLPLLILIPNWRYNDKSRLAEVTELGRAALRKVPRNSIILASGDDWAFALLYVQNVEGVRKDVIIAFEPYFQSRNWRLMQREARRGLVVREVECSTHAKDKDIHGICRIKRFILDNYRRFPFYIAGPFADKLDASRLTKRQLPRYERVVTRVPMLHFLPESEPMDPLKELRP